MRKQLLIVFAAAWGLIASAPAGSQSAAPQSGASSQPQPAWIDHAPEPPTVRRAGIGVPRQAGSLSLTEVKNYDEEGLDDVAQYATADEAISGSIFIYFPTLADTGLTFLATDAAIRSRFGPGTRVAEDSLVTVGGVDKAGRRIVYEGASEGRRSTMAMFVRAGGWILVLRVSGPHSRAGEIGANLDALAAGLRFGSGSNPVPAHVVSQDSCAAGAADRDSKLTKPTGGEISSLVIMAAAGEVRDEQGKALPDMLGRVPDRLCLAQSATRGENLALTYKPVGDAPGLFAPRLFQLIGDAGTIVEVTAAAKKPDQIVAVRHRIGVLDAFGLFDSTPSPGQIDQIARQDGSIPIVARATLSPDGGTNIQVDCNQFREGCAASGEKRR